MPYADHDVQKAKQRGYYHDRRNAAIAERGGKCERCRSTDHLEFHHRDPDDKWTHRFWSLRAEIREAELAKCRHCTRTRVRVHRTLREDQIVDATWGPS